MPIPQILIAGAGPTGLMLALQLARRGIPFRIVDKASGPGEASRALIVHARTLEFYRQLGLADAVLGASHVVEKVRARKNGKSFVEIKLGDIGREVSPYPFVVAFPQDEHERFLVAELAKFGCAVDWNTELVSLSQDAQGVQAQLKRNGATETTDYSYGVGADGAHSIVRRELKLEFSGGTYAQLFYVADVDATGADTTDLLMNLDHDGFALMMPVRTSGMYRLVGLVPDDLVARTNLTFADFQTRAEAMLHVKVRTVNWFSTYHVHHRVASQFQVGRCFLAGDAGHIHSPAGGQGLNTGIGDAVNLGWKLAQVLAGRAPAALLATYEPERIAFARKLVASTDTAFSWMVGQSTASEVLRQWIVPNVMPVLTELTLVRREIFKTISQTGIAYRHSALSAGAAGSVHGGDRLPWVKWPAGDNFVALTSLDWQLHVYGSLRAEMTAAARALHLPAFEYAWTGPAERAGLQRDAVYLVRPDGHVALALPDQDTAQLQSFVVGLGLTFAAVV